MDSSNNFSCYLWHKEFITNKTTTKSVFRIFVVVFSFYNFYLIFSCAETSFYDVVFIISDLVSRQVSIEMRISETDSILVKIVLIFYA